MIKPLTIVGVAVGATELVVMFDDNSTALFKKCNGTLIGNKITDSQHQAAVKYFNPTTVLLK